ncbi:MAG: hypothetical protein GY950_32375, partial [bacterium]|nr:hypothetical protein [bacterium]
YRFEKNGWIYIHIEGSPVLRGYQHGYWGAPEIEEQLRSLKHLTYWNTGKPWEFFVEKAEEIFVPFIDDEYLVEMDGISAGAAAKGVSVTWQEILTINGYKELTDYWWPNQQEGKYAACNRVGNDYCSAFVAAGSATTDGRVVMGHNSWSHFALGQFCNLILDIVPGQGRRIFMQSTPGYINSLTDFFVTGAGIMGTETSIGGLSMYAPNDVPQFVRTRKAMQYADDLDQFVERMLKKNNGGYANSWLLADIDTQEIMRLELGLKYHNVERTGDGYFIGFNAPLDPRIRNNECTSTGFTDSRKHQGARQVRLLQLMENYRGQIDVEIGKEILADHYDISRERDNNPCAGTVDGHYELDNRDFMCHPGRPLSNQPRGAVDGKVMDSTMAKTMRFWARWGNSSGLDFNAEKFLEKHNQWKYLQGYLKNRPPQPWTPFKIEQTETYNGVSYS